MADEDKLKEKERQAGAAGNGGPNSVPYGMFVPSVSTRIRATPQEPALKVPGPVAPTGGEKWGMELPLVPTTLDPRSYNRFAHAAAMTVVENPGFICNPLQIYGGPGSGKSHFLNFIAYSLAVPGGLDSVLFTDGIRLSLGLEAAIRAGAAEKLERTLLGLKALLVDDAHLLHLTDAGAPYVRRLLEAFTEGGRQLVLASGAPPGAETSLEAAMGGIAGAGWTVDLKVPTAQDYRHILAQFTKSLGLNLSEADLEAAFAAQGVPLSEAVKMLGRVKKLERLAPAALGGRPHSGLLGLLSGGSGAEPEEGLPAPSADIPPAAPDRRQRLGIFYPEGMAGEAASALGALRGVSGRLGLAAGWDEAFSEAYSCGDQYAAAFRMGGLAAEKRAAGVAIIGGTGSEVCRIALKVLESLKIKAAWLPAAELGAPAVYARALMDLV